MLARKDLARNCQNCQILASSGTEALSSPDWPFLPGQGVEVTQKAKKKQSVSQPGLEEDGRNGRGENPFNQQLSPIHLAGAQKQLRQFALAKNSLQLAECEERNKQYEQEHGQGQNSPPVASAKVRNTV
jgi:hypothetical protein